MSQAPVIIKAYADLGSGLHGWLKYCAELALPLLATTLKRTGPASCLGCTAGLMESRELVSWPQGHEHDTVGPAPSLLWGGLDEERCPPLPSPLADCGRQESWFCPSWATVLRRAGPVPHGRAGPGDKGTDELAQRT